MDGRLWKARLLERILNSSFGVTAIERGKDVFVRSLGELFKEPFVEPEGRKARNNISHMIQIRRENHDRAAWTKEPMELGENLVRFGQVFDHHVAGDQVKALTAKSHRREIASDVKDRRLGKRPDVDVGSNKQASFANESVFGFFRTA